MTAILQNLRPGLLRLLMVEPEATAKPDQRVFQVAVRVSAAKSGEAFTPREQMDITRLAGGPRRLLERVYPIRLDASGGGGIEVRLTPITGRALLCGAVIEPVDSR